MKINRWCAITSNGIRLEIIMHVETFIGDMSKNQNLSRKFFFLALNCEEKNCCFVMVFSEGWGANWLWGGFQSIGNMIFDIFFLFTSSLTGV